MGGVYKSFLGNFYSNYNTGCFKCSSGFILNFVERIWLSGGSMDLSVVEAFECTSSYWLTKSY